MIFWGKIDGWWWIYWADIMIYISTHSTCYINLKKHYIMIFLILSIAHFLSALLYLSLLSIFSCVFIKMSSQTLIKTGGALNAKHLESHWAQNLQTFGLDCLFPHFLFQRPESVTDSLCQNEKQNNCLSFKKSNLPLCSFFMEKTWTLTLCCRCTQTETAIKLRFVPLIKV